MQQLWNVVGGAMCCKSQGVHRGAKWAVKGGLVLGTASGGGS